MYQYFYNYFKQRFASGLYDKETDYAPHPPTSEERITDDGQIRITDDGQIRVTD